MTVDILAAFGTRLLMLPIGLASSILIARALGPEGKGVYTTALTLVTIALVVGGLGFDRASTVFLARREGDSQAIRATALNLSLYNGIALALVIVLVSAALLPALLPTLPTTVVLIAAPLAFISLVRQVSEGFLRGEQRNSAVNALALIASTTLLVLVATAEVLGVLSPDTGVAARVVSVAVVVVVAAVMLGRGGIGWPPRRTIGMSRRLLVFAWPFALVTLAQGLNYRLDVVLVQGVLGSTDVGWYSISATLAELLWYLPMAVGFVVFPRSAARQHEAAVHEAATVARWTVLVTGLGAMSMAVLCGPFIALAFGDAFAPATEPTRLLLPGIVANVWYQVLGAFLMGRGELAPIRNYAFLGVGLNVLLNVLLLRELGISGAAISSSISYGVVGVLVLRRFSRRFDVPIGELLLPKPSEIRERLSQGLSVVRRPKI